MNRLAGETSPYLRQHADNPVDWYPWGDEAFAVAVDTDRPILLSVGYSSCHWCHVMAHESFEDPATAEVMNRLFVNVKVDREERPDVDAVYMQAVQAMTGHGGWPMTVFLAPDGRPFFGGTYFPREDRSGMAGFVRVLEAVDQAWRERRDDLLEHAGRLHEALLRTAALGDGATIPGDELLRGATLGLARAFDARFGGFGTAPKFPPAMPVDFLLGRHVRTGDERALEMARSTLDAMAAGGLYDQLGGGFHRYSVDAHWLVPHFEKMLYDQALLVRAFLHGHLVTGEARYRTVVEETVGYVLRDLRQPEGGFCSAEDADSEGVEGRFYVWSIDEIQAVCGEDAAEAVRYYGVTPRGNFEGANILHVVDPREPRPDAVERARRRLLEARDRRIRPGRDDKVLLAWNALFLDALGRAAAALQRADWMEAARSSARFLLRSMRRADGRFLRSWQAGRAHHRAYAEDYAALLEALLTLAAVDDAGWLDHARPVAEALLDLFHDDERGGFFTTGEDAEQLIVRPKDLDDGATPAATSLAASGLLRLAALTGEDRYEEPARRSLGLLGEMVAEHPRAFGYALTALERLTAPPLEVVVVGDPADPATRELRQEVAARLLPTAVGVVTAAPADGAAPTPLLAGRGLVDGRPTAYVCERHACRAPTTRPAELGTQLDEASAAPAP